MNQRKCSNCQHWNPVNISDCENCDALIDPKYIAAAELEAQQEIREEEAKANETKFDKWLYRFRTSENPAIRALYFILSTIVTIYMGIVSFFIWLIALISG